MNSRYSTRIQELIRERARTLSLTLRDAVDRYVELIPGLPNNFLNRKKKRNSIARIWDGGTRDPHLSLFIRLVNSLGGAVIIRWGATPEAEVEVEIVLFPEDFDGTNGFHEDAPENE
jgi:hypothetical protein